MKRALVMIKTPQQHILIFCMGVVTALIAILAFQMGHVPFDFQGDSLKYIRPAMGILAHGAYGTFVQGAFKPELQRLPLYPLFIFINYKLFGAGNNFAIVISQAVLMGAITLAVSLCVAQFDKRHVWIAALATAFCPNLFFRAAEILPDLLFAFFIAWGLFFLIRSFYNNFIVNLLLSSVLFGLAMMTRPAFSFYPIFTFPFLIYWLMHTKNFGFVKSLTLALLSLIVIGVTVGPQLYREKLYTGHYMYTSQNGSHPLFWIYPTLARPWGGKRDLQALSQAKQIYALKERQLSLADQNNPAIITRLQHQLAIHLICSIPKITLLKSMIGSSLKLMFYSSTLGIIEAFHYTISFKNLLIDGILIISQTLLLAWRFLQAIGILYGLIKTKYRAMTLYLIAGMFSFISISIGLGNPRYRTPIELILIIFTVIGWAALMHYIKSRKKGYLVDSYATVS